MLLRLNKYLADKGVGSRRTCDTYIEEGLIKVNGKVVCELGTKINPEKDIVETAPEIPLRQQKLVYYALHKPVGFVCSVTGSEKPKITDLLEKIRERVFPVGRLDKLTSGLLLVTNDGRFAYRLTHPRFEKEKEYVVKVREFITPLVLAKLHERFFIQGRLTEPVHITKQSPHLFRVILREGRNRQIRRMCERADLHIEKLKRVRIGTLILGPLAVGAHRKLSQQEVKNLVNLTFTSS